MIYLWFTNTLYYDCNIQLTWSFFSITSLCVRVSYSCLLAIKQQHSCDALFSITHKSRLNFYLMRERGRTTKSNKRRKRDERKKRRENKFITPFKPFPMERFYRLVLRNCTMIDTNYTQMIHRESNRERKKLAPQMQHEGRRKEMNSIRKSPFYLFYSWRIFVLLSLMLFCYCPSFFWFVNRINEKNKMINVR